MQDSPNLPPSLRLDDQNRIDQNVPCANCQYNLRTMCVDGQCPECGQPVGQSLDVNRLCLTDTKWIKRITRGLTVVLFSVIPFIAGLVLLIIFDGPNPGRLIELIELILILQVIPLSFLGHWLFLSPERQGSVFGHDRRRCVARLGMVTGIALFAIAILTALIDPSSDASICGLFIAATWVLSISILGYGKKLAVRIPDRKLAAAIGWYLWIWLMIYSVIFLNIYLGCFELPYPKIVEWCIEVVYKYGEWAFVLTLMSGVVLLAVFRHRLRVVIRRMSG